ncbi:hypothetical protein [Brevibacterium jeotgali]|uniref:Peptide chain release factor 1 (ERF1) n=1 Tax=Brevibacterium jeotgali TaxID=1262550 RepID=A0A2H1L813_9MICO|nr:hypothetical protein [Brevibacterium jeotgali]TWC03365.1 hypothetical protein FB108_2090 [Brevibacterium jeotgali]SMY13027.1 hypothetical protein BJEO58_02635 [Brevibacterium jeotgali]
MQLNEIRRVYDGQAPFVTVYLEGRSPGEDAQQQVRLRWEELRRHLSEDGASDTALSALDEAVLGAEPGEAQSNGRVLVADVTGVVLDEAWDAALGAGDAAHLGKEPELGAFVREHARSARLLVAIADRHGAVVRQVAVAQSQAADTQVEHHVGDASHDPESVHKPREGALSHKNIQRRADEVVKQNVREVAEHMDSVAKTWKPDLIVLAGGVQGRTALRNELSPALREHFTETDAGGVDDDGAEEALANELHRLAQDLSTDAAQRRADQFAAAKAHGLAGEGSERIAQALEMGAVETLLLEYDRPAAREAELLAASVRTDAEVSLIDSQVEDAIAAILRFDVPEQ